MGPGGQAGSEAAPPPGVSVAFTPGRSIPRPAPRPVLTPVPVAREDSGTRPLPGRGRARRRRAWSPLPAAQPALPLGRTVPGAAAQSCRRRHRPGLPQTAGERLRETPAQPWRERRLPGTGHSPPASGAAVPAHPPPARRGKLGASRPASSPRPRRSPPPPPRRTMEFALRPAAPLVEAGSWPLPRPQRRGSRQPLESRSRLGKLDEHGVPRVG